MDSFESYLYGLLLTDGHLSETSRNRGKFTIELDKKDEDVLEKIHSMAEVNSFISERTRRTNFSESSTSVKLSIFDWDFRKRFKSRGFPVGKKSGITAPPTGDFIERDFVRGLIDGDGALGITGNGIPFITFATDSEAMKEYVCDFIFRKTGQVKHLNRNKRDGIYNIGLFKEDAQTVTKELYYKGCVCMNRKLNKARLVLRWKRPKTMVKRRIGITS